MKKKLLVALLCLGSLASQNGSAQTDLLDDRTQSLGNGNSGDFQNYSDEDLLTEAEKLQKEATSTDAESAEEQSPLWQKNGTVPEHELLKTKKKAIKVVAKKATTADIYIQETQKFKVTDQLKPLYLNDVIEQGLRKNYDQQIKGQFLEIDELTFKGQKSAFWLPELKIEIQTADQELATLHGSSRTPNPKNSNSPSGRVGLTLGDYTIFNWGKDYSLYLNHRDRYNRLSQIYNESKRELKHDLIAEYFNLVTLKKIESIRQDQLRQTSFIYRLNKEKITIGKTTRQDYYLARSEYLKSQNDFHDSKIALEQMNEKLAFLIADPIGAKYIINEDLKYTKINFTLEEILDDAKKHNPDILNSKTDIAIQTRDYDIAVKDNMPLPKISINLGAYNQRFGANDNNFRYETYNGGGDVEVVASINTTWALTGEDGLFNSNKLAKSRIKKEIAQRSFDKNSHYAESLIRNSYKTVLAIQNQMSIMEARLTSTQKTFDTVLENYLSGRSRYHDYSLALLDLTEAKIYFEHIKNQHLQEKINLAKLAGIEDFPGEMFEQLAIKTKR